jgi:hypothetical protein
MNSQEDIIDSLTVCEILGISKTNLRQIVFRKLLTPIGKYKRRSTFDRAQVEALKVSRSVSSL